MMNPDRREPLIEITTMTSAESVIRRRMRELRKEVRELHDEERKLVEEIGRRVAAFDDVAELRERRRRVREQLEERYCGIERLQVLTQLL